MMNRATMGTTLKIRKKILKSPRNEYINMLNDSWELRNHLLCVRYTAFGAIKCAIVQKNNRLPFMIVHHIKKSVRVGISMTSLLYLTESKSMSLEENSMSLESSQSDFLV